MRAVGEYREEKPHLFVAQYLFFQIEATCSTAAKFSMVVPFDRLFFFGSQSIRNDFFNCN